ncbi:hypothetical protein HMPREF1984_01364 [Leptotrichia sp. oral taxon 215 str. W9775]|uniref:hypothetical protein n=1 Tax=Leptotrichia sp. oral taxon 215 TaxID=712359 RepID=UPI0003AD9E3D|nr:hypothetical protein [Leptotrichia sp. oral taxon 215]ERK67060.1 hypothetical protein HMPREF1984_01364 [Leptotrichia sp. oral taxon 215 str. W9775]
MPKLVINDKSGKKNTSMNFFLDDKVIKFKENKKEIENVDYGEHTIKVRTLYFKSSKQKINIEKEVTEIEIKQNYRVYLLFVCLVIISLLGVFLKIKLKIEASKGFLYMILFVIVMNLYFVFGNPLVLKVKE